MPGPPETTSGPGSAGAHGFVLLGLDGGDDVAHAAGAFAFEGREQRALPHHVESGLVHRGGVEHLVVDADDLAAVTGEEMAAAHHAHRRHGRRSVERLGHRGPPVDDQGRVLGVVHPEAADVEAAVVGEVEAAEAEGGIADVEGRETAIGGVDRDVAFEAGLVGPAPSDVGIGLRDRGCRVLHRLQALIDRVEIGLFGHDFRVLTAWRHKRLRTMGDRRVYAIHRRRVVTGSGSQHDTTRSRAPAARPGVQHVGENQGVVGQSTRTKSSSRPRKGPR